ncbi:MAG: transcription termination factor NusA [Candidatus Promineifilaceae bacterium]|nr:transcription termination factor NusA [Candidatus Promineifilaceae bacterium]
MKSEFMLAFNEICEARGLPKDVVIEALKTALVSAYRRNTNVSNTQEVEVDIDERTGEPTIYAEKEVVDSVMDPRTEVTLARAKRQGFNDAQLGDTVMVESTPANFGRIAAQTAKQVILQRVREAEREMLYEDFSAREGEIVNGTVQSVTGSNITIGLGRTEALLPRSQQVPRERYRAHDKIRVYVLEVRRTNRGPQIIVSRNHRNLLRRLLELEVPEIYNGQVDIKSIAREAGARSKVAVMAMQPGIDPVGACVGMRGVRIQSIVRELNDEKIDVIEWDPDQETFIAKALSPARVSQVFLEDHPDEGKTAIVIVPDDQLSLAIGREGQNARLAAKLTGWRIDIKSLTEAAEESLSSLDHPAADPAIARNKELIGQARMVLAKKAASRPITSEDYMTLSRLVAGVEGNIIAARAVEYERIQKERAVARQTVPDAAWDVVLEELELSTRVATLLEENHIHNLGSLMMYLEMGDEALLDIDGFGAKALEEVKEAVADYELPPEEEKVLEEEPVAEELAVAEPVTDAVAEEALVEEVEEAEAEPQPVAMEATAEEPVAEEAPVAAPEAVEEKVLAEPEAVEEVPEAETVEEEEEEVPAIEDLGTSLVEPEKPKKKEKKKQKVVIVRTGRAYEEEEEEDERDTDKGKRLVYDEKAGRVVTKRRRKGGRRRPEWEDFEDMDVDEVLDEEL